MLQASVKDANAIHPEASAHKNKYITCIFQLIWMIPARKYVPFQI